MNGDSDGEYENLCRMVEQIDPEAAAYMRGEARKLESFSEAGAGNLGACFYWDETPQGDDFWRSICLRMR